jgi:hypothetical protein
VSFGEVGPRWVNDAGSRTHTSGANVMTANALGNSVNSFAWNEEPTK